MQIVRELGGYTLGRSDLVRRAMSKKKQDVMEKERANFVYGNKEENVPGCVEKGISEEVASTIYDEMMDFAKYAFNKSHAACYAVVSYQTAFLKYYYPVEYMAALMTSVIDNIGKVAEYIISSRAMNIQILPPDVNEGEANFSVSNGCIRYALTAIKGVGRNVVDSIIEERERGGAFTSLKDFISRMSGTDVNKRLVENFIKAGAFDSMGGRRQLLSVYESIMENTVKDRKNNLAGQMSLFDLVDDSQKESFDVVLPDVPEFDKEQLLAYEKEIVGIYISGHPLENYTDLIAKKSTAKSSDFYLDEETNEIHLRDGQEVTIGGLIADRKIKYTKNDKVMAFLNLEDLYGMIEVVVFPRDYERNAMNLNVDTKVFVTGRVQADDEKDGKLIASRIVKFEDMPKTLWLQFENKEDFTEKTSQYEAILGESEGVDTVAIVLKDTKQFKKLPPNCNVSANEELIEKLSELLGAENVKLVY